LMKDNTVYWKMRNGKLISVDDMDINHLRNVLKMIIRNHEKAIQAKPKVEFKFNGDMAQEFNDSHYSDIDDIQWSDGEFYKE
ncbi:MAG TPA: hypothetical protein P5513_01270, partial [Candidatus Diapherotrites archaeon]|nr:hypothetical protein [Candidatus Diapherotrites archaeon]